MKARIPVLVCGEAQRGDDGAARAAVEMLPAEAAARVDVRVVGQLGVDDLLDVVATGSACVVVDAVAGIPPGELWVRPLADLVERAHRLEATGRAVEPRSSHELPIDQALALVAALRGAPPAGTFVGIGGAAWALGTPPSRAVATALPALASAIVRAVDELAGDEGRGAG